MDENAVKSIGGNVGGAFGACVGGGVGSGGGGKGALLMNYCDFKKFLESRRTMKVPEKSKFCVIQ